MRDGEVGQPPSSEFVTELEEGDWTCMDKQVLWQKLHWHNHKLTKHIAGKKFLNDRNMDVLSCTPAATIKQGNQYVPTMEQQALFKRACQLLLKYIQQHDEKNRRKDYGVL